MSRLLKKLRPTHGWNAAAWDLAIVTLGVLLALTAQQWAENRTMRGKVEASKAAIREELAEHYDWAVEFRTVYPCVKAQVGRLREHVLASGPVMDPVPIYEEQNFHFVLRFPSKEMPTDAWDEAVNDGLMQRFDPSFRNELRGHYAVIPQINNLVSANDATEQGLAALAHRLPLESTVRYYIVKEIEQLSGRLDTLDLDYGQQIENIQKVKMLPPAEHSQAATERYGTYKFCKAHGLPMRSFKEAMQAVPN